MNKFMKPMDKHLQSCQPGFNPTKPRATSTSRCSNHLCLDWCPWCQPKPMCQRLLISAVQGLPRSLFQGACVYPLPIQHRTAPHQHTTWMLLPFWYSFSLCCEGAHVHAVPPYNTISIKPWLYTSQNLVPRRAVVPYAILTQYIYSQLNSCSYDHFIPAHAFKQHPSRIVFQIFQCASCIYLLPRTLPKSWLKYRSIGRLNMQHAANMQLKLRLIGPHIAHYSNICWCQISITCMCAIS